MKTKDQFQNELREKNFTNEQITWILFGWTALESEGMTCADVSDEECVWVTKYPIMSGEQYLHAFGSESAAKKSSRYDAKIIRCVPYSALEQERRRFNSLKSVADKIADDLEQERARSARLVEAINIYIKEYDAAPITGGAWVQDLRNALAGYERGEG